jgi:histidinol-phosphate phosphatase family protein
MKKALFLDRDGVINIEQEGSYILHKNDFHFYPGALDAIVKLSSLFDYVIVVTNQRGVGRGIMTEKDLLAIHEYMQQQVIDAGGRMDRIYYATALEDDHTHRKPNTGMALDAQRDFPDINFEQSVMVGNNLSDMKFGKVMGMRTVFLHTTKPPQLLPHPLIDMQYDGLLAWSQTV